MSETDPPKTYESRQKGNVTGIQRMVARNLLDRMSTDTNFIDYLQGNGFSDIEIFARTDPGGDGVIWLQDEVTTLTLFVPTFEQTRGNIATVYRSIKTLVREYIDEGKQRTWMTLDIPDFPMWSDLETRNPLPYDDESPPDALEGVNLDLSRAFGVIRDHWYMFHRHIGPNVAEGRSSRNEASAMLSYLYECMGLMAKDVIHIGSNIGLRPVSLPMNHFWRSPSDPDHPYIPYYLDIEVVSGKTVLGKLKEVTFKDGGVDLRLRGGIRMWIPKRAISNKMDYPKFKGLYAGPSGSTLKVGYRYERTNERGTSEVEGDMEILQEEDHESEVQGLPEVRGEWDQDVSGMEG